VPLQWLHAAYATRDPAPFAANFTPLWRTYV